MNPANSRPAPAQNANPVGIEDLPYQQSRLSALKVAKYTLLVVGGSGSGKTTFVNTLFASELLQNRSPQHVRAKQVSRTIDIEMTKAQLEEKQFRLALTVIDTPGFGDYVNNRDSWGPIVDFIDDQLESYMRQEQQPERFERNDTRVHACVYFIRPTGHSLTPLDIAAMKALGTRVNLIPVIGKADTLTSNELITFKAKIRECILRQDIHIFQPPVWEDDEAEAAHARALASVMPFAVIGAEPDPVQTPDGRRVKGRKYDWGIAEVENTEHCDFKLLRSLLIRLNMLDLITSTEEKHYESYRREQMETRKFGEPKVKKPDNAQFKEREEALRRAFTEQVKVEESRFRDWEQKLIAERDRLNRDLESVHTHLKAMENDLTSLEIHSRSSSSAYNRR